MPTKRTDKPATIYAIWDTQEGCWWVATQRYGGKYKCAWTAGSFAKRAFAQKTNQRLDEQTRYVIVDIIGDFLVGAGFLLPPEKAAA